MLHHQDSRWALLNDSPSFLANKFQQGLMPYKTISGLSAKIKNSTSSTPIPCKINTNSILTPQKPATNNPFIICGRMKRVCCGIGIRVNFLFRSPPKFISNRNKILVTMLKIGKIIVCEGKWVGKGKFRRTPIQHNCWKGWDVFSRILQSVREINYIINCSLLWCLSKRPSSSR